MKIITFKKIGKILGVGELSLVLNTVIQQSIATWWIIEDLDGSGPAISSFNKDPQRKWSTEELLRITNGIYQLIDAEFRGFSISDERPWIIVRFVDGSEVDVESDNQDLLKSIKSTVPFAQTVPN